MKTSNLMIVLLLACLFPSIGWTKVEYDLETLRMKNAEQVNALVLTKIKKAQAIQKKQEVDDDSGILAEPDAIAELQAATMIVLSRPDQDGSRANTFARVRRELTDLSSFETVIKDIAREAIDALKDKSTSVREQATYAMVLDNLMAEIKPDVSKNADYKKIIEDVRDANIKISDKLRTSELLRSMTRPVSPSVTATTIIGKKK